jgi:hypothetical protein
MDYKLDFMSPFRKRVNVSLYKGWLHCTKEAWFADAPGEIYESKRTYMFSSQRGEWFHIWAFGLSPTFVTQHCSLEA